MRFNSFLKILSVLALPILAKAQQPHFIDNERATISSIGQEVHQIAIFNPTTDVVGLSIFTDFGLTVQQPHYGVAYPADTLKFWLIADPEVPPGNNLLVFLFRGGVDVAIDTLDVMLNIRFSEQRDILKLWTSEPGHVSLFEETTFSATLYGASSEPIEIVEAFMVGDDHQHYTVHDKPIRATKLSQGSSLDLPITYLNNGYRFDPSAKLAVRYAIDEGTQVALLPLIVTQQPIIEPPAPFDLGKVPSGLYVFSTLGVTNEFHDTVHLGYGMGSGNFMTFLTPIDGPTVKVPPGTSEILLQHYIEHYEDEVDSYLEVEPWSSSRPFHHDPFPMSFSAHGRYYTGHDTAFFPVFAKQTTATPLIYDEDYGIRSHHRYTYYNDSGDSLTVTRLEVLGSGHWSIVKQSRGPAPFRLGPDERFFVEYELENDTSFIFEALIIETDDALPLPWQAIKGAKDPTSLVSGVETKVNTSLELSLYPNPATDRVRISASDFVVGSIVLHDATGRIVYRSSFAGQSSIDLKDLGLSEGQYFVTLNGRDVLGRMVYESKPFTILKK